MATTRLVLVGAGGHALVVAESAKAAGFDVVGFYDDDRNAPLAKRFGVPCLGGLAGASECAESLIVALGDLRLRAGVIARLGSARLASVVNSAAYVSASATVGPGVFVGPLAVVHTLARIGAHAIINTGAIVEHECEIGESSHIAPGAALGGNVRIGARTLIGLGASVIPGVRVGDGCIVGAGAVVIRDVPDGAVVVGAPAQPAHRA